MDSSPHITHTSEELLTHVSWAQHLARGLVSDSHQAEDLAQESVLAVLRERDAVRSPRRFLSRVARNLAYLELRRRERRDQREREVAHGESIPSTLDQLERRSSHS